MTIIGIDPGASGCIAILDADTFHYYDISTSENIYHDLQSIKNIWPIANVYLETTYIHGRATRGIMRFLHDRGGLFGACSVLWGKVHDVRPQAWQKPYDAPKEYKARKEYFVKIAMEMFPEAEIKTTNKDRTSGRADATLIAHHGRHEHLNPS